MSLNRDPPLFNTTMTETAVEQPRGLLGLPDELKLDIASYLDRKRDLYNLSLTCQCLEDIVSRRLYTKVDVELPQNRDMAWTTGGYLMFRPHVVQSIRELAVRNGLMDFKNTAYSRRERSDAGSVDGYVRQVLGYIPPDQLMSLEFLHSTPMSMKLLDVLTSRHAGSLRELRLSEIEQAQESTTGLPQDLVTFECRSISDGEAVGKIVQASQLTLQTLSLGQEKSLVEQYWRTRVGFLEQIPQPLESLKHVLQLSDFPNLRQLDLCGLDVSPLVPASFEEALSFCRLTRLSLESCVGSAAMLESLAGTFYFVQNAAGAPQPCITPQLTDFSFRSEAPTTLLKESMIRFLASFRGLKRLSLLFENAALLERASTMIAEHGPTLQTLVLESRIQPRENLSLDTSRPFGVGGYSFDLWEESISDICRLCPNLVELGTGFPWNDEIVRLRKTLLPTLNNLRTIHVRNFPESQVLSQLGDYTIKEYAIKFIEWVFPALKSADRPHLETLAIGPTLYESRWKSSSMRRQPPEFARTHYYCLDWAQTRFGRWSPMITGVSEKCIEELREEKPLRGVFEQVWLR